MLPPDLTPLPGYHRVIVCAEQQVDGIRARVAELGEHAERVVIVGTGYLQPGEGYTWHRPAAGG